MYNPRLLTLTLTNANTNYQLNALLAAADTELGASPFQSARRIVIQADLDAGATSFKIGNTDLSATNFGCEFLASQSVLYEDDNDTIVLSEIWLRTDAAGKKINVAIQFR